jgi:glycerophosphoryl diester phosphodiesterase
MAAFRLAAEMGADGVELDVQLCEDVEAVVFHNARVDETTDGGGRVVDLTPAELQGLDAGAWFVPDLAGERIPTLAQVLHELGARLALDIELKTGGLFSDGLEAEIVTLVEESNIGLRVVACIFRAEN